MRAAFSLARTRAASASRSDAASFTAIEAMVRGLGGGGPLRRGSREDEGGGLGGLDGLERTGERVRAVLAVLEVLGERDRLFLEFGGERGRDLAVVVDLDRVIGAAGFPSFLVEALGADAVLLAGCTAAFDGGAGFAVASGEVDISGLVVVFFFWTDLDTSFGSGLISRSGVAALDPALDLVPLFLFWAGLGASFGSAVFISRSGDTALEPGLDLVPLFLFWVDLDPDLDSGFDSWSGVVSLDPGLDWSKSLRLGCFLSGDSIEVPKRGLSYEVVEDGLRWSLDRGGDNLRDASGGCVLGPCAGGAGGSSSVTARISHVFSSTIVVKSPGRLRRAPLSERLFPDDGEFFKGLSCGGAGSGGESIVVAVEA